MATARDASQDVVEALRLGANDYVTKPLDFDVVLARVQTQLALKQQSDEIRRLARDLDLRNRFIQNTFGRFLSDEVVRGLLETPEGLKLGGESRRVTILMSDLRGFTALSERLGPDQVVRVLNRYLGAMAEIILEHRGTIDEFIGDAILAIFGAPVSREDDARRALSCAVSMQRRLAEVNRLNAEDGLPPLEAGIAVHTGEVVVGNIGSEKRTKYGVVGPPVNLAGRIESYTVGGQVLVSEAAVEAAGGVALLGEKVLVKAKGARQPVTAFDLRGVAGPPDLLVPQRSWALARLVAPLAVRVAPLEGKRLGEESFAGQLVATDVGGAQLISPAALGVHGDVRLNLFAADGAELPGDAYAKVMAADHASSSYLLRFTSLPAECAERLAQARKTTP
jgi:class 3 adenylate cyclase